MLYHVHLALAGFELTTLVVIRTDCIGVLNKWELFSTTIRSRPRRPHAVLNKWELFSTSQELYNILMCFRQIVLYLYLLTIIYLITCGSLVGSVLLLFLVFNVVVLGIFTLWLCCAVRYDFCIKTMFVSSLPPVVCRRVIYVICVCSSVSPVVCRRVIYVIYVCLSLSPVVCRRVVYVICVCLSVSPVVCRRVIYVICVCSSVYPVGILFTNDHEIVDKRWRHTKILFIWPWDRR